MPTKSDSYSWASRNLVVCVYNTLCKSGYDKELASKMQMTKIKSVTKEQVDEAIVYDRKYIQLILAHWFLLMMIFMTLTYQWYCSSACSINLID